MTDLATPGEVGAEIDGASAANAFDKAGTGAWIVDGVDIAGYYTALDETALNAFAHASSSGLDVTIDPGEAYVGGWLCRDTTTTVSLNADSTTTIYAGIDVSAILADGEAPADHANVIVGPASAFATEDPRTAIWEFVTDADSVTGSTDLRQLDQPITFDATAGVATVAGGVDIGGQATISGGLDAENGVAPHLDDDAFLASDPLSDYPAGYSIFRDAQADFPKGTNSVVETVAAPGPNNGFQINWDSGGAEFIYRIANGSDEWGAWQHPVRSDSGYEIQKDGSDGTGVINFKTDT